MTSSEYIVRLSALVKKRWNMSRLEVKMKDIHYCGIRISFSEILFLDVYYNSFRHRKDFSLVKNGERIFGIDNYRGWHVHPQENPHLHEPCEEIGEEEILERVDGVLLKLKS